MSNKPKDFTIPNPCKTCRIIKNPEEFYPINRAANRQHLSPGRMANCKLCHNKLRSDKKKEMGEGWHKIENERKKKWYDANADRAIRTSRNAMLKRTYGITHEEYDVIFHNQNGCCAICKKPEKRFNKKTKQFKRLAVDHCHATGNIRGLLCFSCNGSLGKFEDSIETLKSAIAYLENSNGTKT